MVRIILHAVTGLDSAALENNHSDRILRGYVLIGTVVEQQIPLETKPSLLHGGVEHSLLP